MKNLIIIFLTLIATSSFFSCVSQRYTGLYYHEETESFISIKNDSISIGFKRSPTDILYYFYGCYHFVNDSLTLSNNLLKSNNAIVKEIPTEYHGTEIQVYTLFPRFTLGAPQIYNDSAFYTLAKHASVSWNYATDPASRSILKVPNVKTKTGLIKISSDTITNKEPIELLIMGNSFITEQNLALKPFTRYEIKQKSLYQSPLEPKQLTIVYNTEEKSFYVYAPTSHEKVPYKLYKLICVGNSNSCFKELRKRHPDL